MAKLTNFAEVDAFVIVASAETSLIEARDFPVPLITPLELEVALGVREWTGFYSTSFADLRLGEDEAERRQGKGKYGGEGEGGTGGGADDGSEDEDEAPVFSLVSSGFVDSRRSRAKPGRTTLTLEFEGGGGGEGGKAATTTTLAAYRSPAADFLMQVRARGQTVTTLPTFVFIHSLFECDAAEVKYSAL